MPPKWTYTAKEVFSSFANVFGAMLPGLRKPCAFLLSPNPAASWGMGSRKLPRGTTPKVFRQRNTPNPEGKGRGFGSLAEGSSAGFVPS